MASDIALDTPLVRVPFESLKRITRDRKYAIDEITTLLDGINRAASSADATQASEQLGEYAEKLRSIKRGLEEIGVSEADDARRCQARLQHLRSIGTAEKEGYIDWSRKRIDRIIVDHLLRQGQYNAALKLVQTGGLQDLTDVHIFLAARCVIEGLRAHDCAAALAWCEQNKARLKKNKSQLEFRLRMQEYIELLRQGNFIGAIRYAQSYMAPSAPQHLVELQQAAAALAFHTDTQCDRYSALYAAERWQDLETMFRNELYKLHAQPPVSLLSVYLEAGLSALKTPSSYEPGCSREDPLHLPEFKKLAEGLPSAKHVHSKLICAITHQVMNEHNPPLVLPNGYVYSEQAMSMMAAENDGMIRCPCTGLTFKYVELRRAYVS